jgi:hypothetical protein
MLYNLTVTKKQLQMIDRALEAVARMSIGQPAMCVEYALENDSHLLLKEGRDIIESVESIIKPAIGLSRNSSYGVGKYPYTDNIIDIHEVIRYHLSWEHAEYEGLVNEDGTRNWSKMMGVNYDKPHHWGDEQLPSIEKVSPFVVVDNDENYVSLVKRDVYNRLKENGIKAVLECDKQNVRDMTARAEYYLTLIRSGMMIVDLTLGTDEVLYELPKEVVFEDILYVVQDGDKLNVQVFVYKDSIEQSIKRINDIFKSSKDRQDFQDRLFEAYKVV